MSTLKIPAPAFVGISRALQAAATPLVAFLVAHAGGMEGGTVKKLSYCNVLLVGNLCAAGLVFIFFGRKKLGSELFALPRKVYLELFVFGCCAALLSALIYTALDTTTVNNAILLARLGPLLYAIGTAVLLKRALKTAEWGGFAFVIVGLFVTVALSDGFRRGDVLILASALVFAFVTLLSKRLLDHVGLGAVVFCRNLISAVAFFCIGSYFYGLHHFAEAFEGRLWIVMTVYALVVIVASQLAWYYAVDKVDAATIAKWTVLTPILAFGYAFLLNGEVPSRVQLVALALVTIGVVLSNVGKLLPKQPDHADGSVAGG